MKVILFIIIVILGYIFYKCNSKENYNPNITFKGINLMPLDIPVPNNVPVYKGYTFNDYDSLCPNNGKTKRCKDKTDCGPAEVCINDGTVTYCNCSIVNDCIQQGVC